MDWPDIWPDIPTDLSGAELFKYAPEEVTQAIGTITVALEARHSEFLGPLDRTKDGLYIIGCIEPRPDAENSKTMLQRPGGGHGTAKVKAVVGAEVAEEVDVKEPEGLVLEDRLIGAMQEVVGSQDTHVLSAHKTCTAVAKAVPILRDMVSPTRRMRDRSASIGARFGIKPYHFEHVSLQAAKILLALPPDRQSDPDRILGAIGDLHPNHNNVRDVIDPSRGMLYVTSLHPDKGFKKELFHERSRLVQVYFDTLGVALAHAKEIYGGGLSKKRLAHVRAAEILLTGATEHVLKSAHPYLQSLEIGPDALGV